LNLVGNAIKFTPAGEVAVHVTESSDGLTFSVEDTGIGIAARERERIFSPFFQADGSISRRFGGTGLGLTISSRLVELMGGKLELASTSDTGSVFRFTLPLPPSQSKGRARSLPAPFGNGRAFVGAHCPTTRKVVAGILSGLGWSLGETEFSLAVVDEIPATRLAARVVLLSPVDEPIRQSPHIDAWLKEPVLEESLVRAIEGTPEPSPAGENAVQLPPLRILVAEDNLVNQRVVTGILEKRKHTVVVADDGAKAIDLWRGGGFDLVLMDVQMPGIDGMEATRRIRAEEQSLGLQRTPVIALTAHALAGDSDRCMEAGMDGYVTKPVHPVRLLSEIARFAPAGAGAAAS